MVGAASKAFGSFGRAALSLNGIIFKQFYEPESFIKPVFAAYYTPKHRNNQEIH